MKKILVTGSKGQLGSEIKQLSYTYNNHQFLFHDVDTLDLTNFSQLEDFLSSNSPDYIVNCAGYTAVDKAETDTDMAYLLNSEVPGKLAEISHKYKARLIHISSDYVFDGKNHKPYIEEDIPNPQSVYGKSKLEGEKKDNEI